MKNLERTFNTVAFDEITNLDILTCLKPLSAYITRQSKLRFAFIVLTKILQIILFCFEQACIIQAILAPNFNRLTYFFL